MWYLDISPWFHLNCHPSHHHHTLSHHSLFPQHSHMYLLPQHNTHHVQVASYLRTSPHLQRRQHNQIFTQSPRTQVSGPRSRNYRHHFFSHQKKTAHPLHKHTTKRTCRGPCIITDQDNINTKQLSPVRETTQYPPSPRANMTLEVIYVTRHGVRSFAIFPMFHLALSHLFFLFSP